MGDPVRMAMLEKVVNVVEEDSLLERTKNAGIALLNHLKELTVRAIQLNILLTLFFPMFPFDPPENIRKPKVF